MEIETQKKKNIETARLCFERLIKDISDKDMVKYLCEKFKEASKDYESLFALLAETIRNSEQAKFLASIKIPFARAQMEKILRYNHQILDIMGRNIEEHMKKKNRKKKNIDKWRRIRHEKILSLDKRYFLIYGKCQSGKTRFMQDIVFTHILINKCAGIVILRNSIGDSQQLMKRCDEYRRDCQEWMNINHPGVKGEGLNFVYANNASKITQIKDALSGKKPALIIVIANSTQMKRLKGVINDTKDPRYVVAIDEADKVAYGDQATNFRTILQTDILPKAGRVYGVTATSFDMLFTEDKIDSASVIIMERDELYKGLKHIELRALPKELTLFQKKKREENLQIKLEVEENMVFNKDTNIIRILSHLGNHDCRKNIINHNICNTSCNSDHPTITIIKNTNLNSTQYKLLKHIIKHPKLTMWCGLIFNGQGITVYHPKSHLLKKMNGKSPSYKKWHTGEVVENTLFFKKVTISDGLEYLRELNIILKKKGEKRITHIAVIAGELADRGISFVSSSYKWHPTSMYYMPSKTATVSHIIQAVGRLCGNFDDNIPLQLFAPYETLKDLCRGMNLQDDILDRVKKNIKGCAVTALMDMQITEEKIPSRNIGYQVENEEIAIKLDTIDEQDNGVDMDTFQEDERRIIGGPGGGGGPGGPGNEDKKKY